MIPIGTILDNRYEILEHIGTGGMADVYKARCHKLNRYVAVKVLRSEYNDDEGFVKRFQAEAQATAGLVHPNIVSVYDVGHEHNIYYIVMELAEGMTLKRYIRRYGRLSVRETVDFALQIASGIQAAHVHRIIHRDIKPQNIMVSDSGKIMVTDFGIAKAVTGDTITTNTMGSVRYLSPEQARGGFSDERSDIYSLGITIYEMATGKVPFDGDNTVAIALAHLHEEMTPPRCFFPDIPVSLEKIIMKCCKKQPSARYQNVGELIDDLKQVFSSPDGGFVYMKDVEEDDSPTIIRTPEEIKKINHSVIEPEEETVVSGSASEPLFKKKNPNEEIEEDTEDDEEMGSRMQKVILTIAVVVGILFALILFYMVASMMHLVPGGKHESTTMATTEAIATTEMVKTVKMPNLEKYSKKEAEQKCKEFSLVPVFTYEDDVEKEDQDDKKLIVLSQSIEKGTKVPRDSKVELHLGWDPTATTEAKQVEVPPLMDYSEEDAVDLLESLKLKVQKVYATSDTVKAGYVIKQSPAGGNVVDVGFTVTITVSQGLAKVAVPSLYGVSKEVAEAELNRVGLVLGTVSSDYSGDVGIGDVISQSVDPRTMVTKGTAVSIVVSLGELETFTYQGDVFMNDCPLADGESAHIKLVLNQDGQTRTIYNKNISSSDFPFTVNFEGFKEGTGVVVMYVNDEEYDRYDVYLSAIAD